MRALVLLLAMTLASNASGESDVTRQERCGVMMQDASGLGFAEAPGFSVQTAELPLRTPAGYDNVRSIMCGRPSLFIADNDYHVLIDLSMTLNITDGERLLVFEISEGQFRARMISGEMTEAESVAIQAALNRAQSIIQGETP